MTDLLDDKNEVKTKPNDTEPFEMSFYPWDESSSQAARYIHSYLVFIIESKILIHWIYLNNKRLIANASLEQEQ